MIATHPTDVQHGPTVTPRKIMFLEFEHVYVYYVIYAYVIWFSYVIYIVWALDNWLMHVYDNAWLNKYVCDYVYMCWLIFTWAVGNRVLENCRSQRVEGWFLELIVVIS